MSEPNASIEAILEEERDRIFTPEGKRMMEGEAVGAEPPSALYQRIIEKVREAVDTATDAKRLSHEVSLLTGQLAMARASVTSLMKERDQLRAEIALLRKRISMAGDRPEEAPNATSKEASEA